MPHEPSRARESGSDALPLHREIIAERLPGMIIFASISVFLASFVKGITAFGFNLVAVSALLFFLSPKLIVPVITLLSSLSSLYMLGSLMKHVEVRRILPLFIGGLAGIPGGVFLLVILQPDIIKILMGIMVTGFSLLFASGFRKEIKNETIAFIFIGLLSGILFGSTSLGGIPVILFFINQDCDKLTFRANLTLYYTVMGAVSFGGFFQGNLVTGEVLKYSLILLLPMLLGIAAGMKLVHRVNEKLFKQIALVIITASGIAAIITGLKGIG
jgi:uncharacterized membrane protein YfcA